MTSIPQVIRVCVCVYDFVPCISGTSLHLQVGRVRLAGVTESEVEMSRAWNSGELGGVKLPANTTRIKHPGRTWKNLHKPRRKYST